MTFASLQVSMDGEPKGINAASEPFLILFSSSSIVAQLLRAIVSIVEAQLDLAWRDVDSPIIEFKSSLALPVRSSKSRWWAVCLE